VKQKESQLKGEEMRQDNEESKIGEGRQPEAGEDKGRSFMAIGVNGIGSG